MIIIDILNFNASFDNIQPGEGVKWGGQGPLFSSIFIFVIAIIFLIVMTLNALIRKTGRSFYWWMCLFIFLPLIAVLIVFD